MIIWTTPPQEAGTGTPRPGPPDTDGNPTVVARPLAKVVTFDVFFTSNWKN